MLYQAKNAWQWARASSMQPKRAGKSGRYFIVLNCASEYGLSSETCGRLWLLVMSRSTSSAATGLERMLAPRSACRVSMPGTMSCRADGLGDELLGEVGALALGDHPAHDVAAEDVQDHVEVEAGPLRRPLELGDVPGPDLVGRRWPAARAWHRPDG